ncbi:uncharacterized protein LOC134258282 [Saccostrea cucullata]|uniref:uncharacterized protein LOC134258282 n=1 Tax=Saccostrea cuccullata TaxID=36930 RepID=UPI002ED0AA5B
MYISPSYITENRNGDVIVSDIGCNAVVVTDRHGNHRFSYTGPPSESGLLLPLGICTDALSHILVCDYNSETIQMIDENGQFLSIILTHKEGIYGPGGLSYDDKTNLLWVGSFGNNTVNIFKCMDRDSMAGIDVDDNLKCNFEDSYLNLQSNTRHQQIHRREEIKDFSNLKSYVHKQTHILTKLNTTQNGKEESINRENLEKKEDAKELPSGSKNSLLALCDTLEPQPDGIQKTESDREPHEKGSKEMKDGIPEKAIGVDLVLINYTQPSDEASTVLRSISAPRLSRNLPVITENYARKLFKKHSNLTLISASPYKSSGYLKGKHIIVEKHCISLLCLHKGYIPFGEREFPKQINGFEVDVQEGYCTLGSGRSIDVGGHIRRARGINTPGHGSIGGFVDLSNGSVGLITCAHVVFSTDELFKANSEIEDYVLCRNTDLNVEFFDRNEHNFEVCGNIVKKCFPSSVDDISVDAALIELDQSVNEFGFPVVLADQLYLAGFEPNKPPVFTGEVVSFPDPETERHRSSDVSQRSGIPGRLNSVIKYGSQTRFTIGNFYFDRVHIRFLNNTLDLPGRNGFATMYNQIEIQSLPHGTFFEAGDSGAFVFCINVDKTLSCLGMAIGSSTRGSCLVTPMTRILDSFSLPHSLKPCSAFNPTNTSQGSQSEQQNNASAGVDLGTILLNLQTSITNIQTELGNFRSEVQSEVGNLSAQVQEIKDRFQTKLPGSSDNTNKK